MYLARISFEAVVEGNRDAMKDAAEWYLVALRKNGQVCGNYLFAWRNSTLVAYSHVARPNALNKRYHTDWTTSALDAVVGQFGQAPTCEIIEDDVPKRFSNWSRSRSLYLFTHAFDDASPICCGDTGRPVPLYLLPTDQQTRQDIYFWARSYNHHDNIWLGSGELEIPAYKQLADPASYLSITGRELCADVERATQKPTFYFMYRYWGRNAGEVDRTCPVCGGKWELPQPVSESKVFHEFQFRCMPCRLVSNCAVAFDDERHARIGEFKKSKMKSFK